MVCLMSAWAPGSTSVSCSRGYSERHVFRVQRCPQWQFMRGLCCSNRPMAVHAISEELVQRGHEQLVNGASLQHLEQCSPRQQSTETTIIHAGEREGRPRVSDSLTTPIVQTATFTFRWRVACHALHWLISCTPGTLELGLPK